jgi:hypothetical protein
VGHLVILFAKSARRRSRVEEREPDYGAQLLAQLLLAGLPVPEAEVTFVEGRKWAFDFAYRSRRLGIEIEGGHWSGGRHVRGKGFEDDCRKYNAASLTGWRLLRVTGAMVESGEAVELIGYALTVLGEE